MSRLEHHARRDDLSPPGVRYAEDRRLANRRMLADDRLDLAGVDILPARNDHVLHAIEDVEISLGILIADVSGPKQAVPERPARLVHVVPVAAHDIRAPSHQFTGMAGLDVLSCIVDDPQIDS